MFSIISLYLFQVEESRALLDSAERAKKQTEL